MRERRALAGLMKASQCGTKPCAREAFTIHSVRKYIFMFYDHINAQMIIKLSDRVVRGELYLTSTPYPKLIAIYLVLGQSDLQLVSSTATIARINKKKSRC